MSQSQMLLMPPQVPRFRGRLQYLIHWEGYPREDDTWEPLANVEHAMKMVGWFQWDNPD
jgi:hypothetical protein